MTRMDSAGNDWQRLADIAVADRERRGWSQIEVATRGGLSVDRVQAIESARHASYRGSTLRAFERGMMWAENSARLVLRGGDPIPLGEGRVPVEAASPTRVTQVDSASVTRALDLLRAARNAVGPVAFDAAVRLLGDEGMPNVTAPTERGTRLGELS